jgi:hypothetical protein
VVDPIEAIEERLARGIVIGQVIALEVVCSIENVTLHAYLLCDMLPKHGLEDDPHSDHFFLVGERNQLCR